METCTIKGKYWFKPEEIWITKEDVTKTQNEIDKMSEDELSTLNQKVECYASGVTSDIYDYYLSNLSYLKHAAKSLQWLKDNKDPHPFWRVKAAIELVTLRIPYKTYKFTQGLKIDIGDTSTDLFCFKMIWDKEKQSFKTEFWYRVYKKHRPMTPEEQEEFNKNWAAKKEKERQARWKRNYERMGCKEGWLDRKFKGKYDEIFTLKDLNTRNKKFPYYGHIEYPETSKQKSGGYSISEGYFKSFKIMAKEKVGGKCDKQ